MYNEIGQLTEEVNVSPDDPDQYIEYDVSGKVRKVYSTKVGNTFDDLKVEFIYDDRGFRLAKVVYGATGARTTWYVRDASGNLISTYEQVGAPTDSNGAPQLNTEDLDQTEVPIYGSGKLGTFYPGQNGSTAYEIADHLGNVRALLRDHSNVFVATMEDTYEADYQNPRVEEMQYFQNLGDIGQSGCKGGR